MYIQTDNNKITKTKNTKGYILALIVLCALIVAQVGLLYVYESVHITGVYSSKFEGDPKSIAGIIPYFVSYDEDVLTIEVSNTNDIDLTLISVHDIDNEYVYEFEDNILLDPSSGDLVFHTYTFDDVDAKLLKNMSSVYISYMYDDFIERQVPIVPLKRYDRELFASTDVITTDNLDEFDFILMDEEYVSFSGDYVTIDRPMFIPQGHKLMIYEGQTIDLQNNAYIHLRDAIMAVGSDISKTSIISTDSTGRGIFVSNAPTKSNLSHITFDGLDAPKNGVWQLTGAVTFYKSDVDISDCVFRNNICEDMLNIVNSTFEIVNTGFESTFADAFDSDFCSGTIRDSYFLDTGNDGLDVSGSTVTATSIDFRRIGDKAISGGENSKVTVDNINIYDTQIGIASKDMSLVTGKDVTIENMVVGITLYQKKDEFGPANIRLDNLTLLGNIDLSYLIQSGSSLTIDDEYITPKDSSKESLLFDKMINGEPLQ